MEKANKDDKPVPQADAPEGSRDDQKSSKPVPETQVKVAEEDVKGECVKAPEAGVKRERISMGDVSLALFKLNDGKPAKMQDHNESDRVVDTTGQDLNGKRQVDAAVSQADANKGENKVETGRKKLDEPSSVTKKGETSTVVTVLAENKTDVSRGAIKKDFTKYKTSNSKSRVEKSKVSQTSEPQVEVKPPPIYDIIRAAARSRTRRRAPVAEPNEQVVPPVRVQPTPPEQPNGQGDKPTDENLEVVRQINDPLRHNRLQQTPTELNFPHKEETEDENCSNQ